MDALCAYLVPLSYTLGRPGPPELPEMPLCGLGLEKCAEAVLRLDAAGQLSPDQ